MFRNIICSLYIDYQMTTMINTSKYKCISCDYVTSRKSQYDRHLNTRKHILITNGLQLGTCDYVCECGKEYSCRQNLFRHKQKCKGAQEQIQVPPPVDSSLVIELLKQNQEFKELMIEQHKRMTEQQNTIIELSKIIGTHTTINTNS